MTDMTGTLPECRCVDCGCTDSRACPGGCSWYSSDINQKTGLCSKCALWRLAMNGYPVRLVSSQIAGLRWIAQTGRLWIWFWRGGRDPDAARKGGIAAVDLSVYEYESVPAEIPRTIIRAESAGRSFNQNVKAHPQRFPYRKLTGTELDGTGVHLPEYETVPRGTLEVLGLGG